MIASLRGPVTHVGLDHVVVEVGGVGMLVHTTPATASSFRRGTEATLATTLVVREDSLTLYGFEGAADRDMFETVQGTSPTTSNEETAFAKWLDQTSDREQARLDRLHGAEGIIPWPLWAALIFTALVIFVFMMFFADSGEARLVQGVQVGSVTLVVIVLLMLIRFLDHPFQEGAGGLQPTAMNRTLQILEVEQQDVGNRGPLPCDQLGRPR